MSTRVSVDNTKAQTDCSDDDQEIEPAQRLRIIITAIPYATGSRCRDSPDGVALHVCAKSTDRAPTLALETQREEAADDPSSRSKRVGPLAGRGREEAVGASVDVFMVFSQDKVRGSVLRADHRRLLLGLDRVQQRFVEQDLEAPRVGLT